MAKNTSKASAAKPANTVSPTTFGHGIINPAFSAARPQAVYDFPYGVPNADDIKAVLVRILENLEANTPAKLVHRETEEEITNTKRVNPKATLAKGDFNLIGYEWGVTYSGMLRAAEATRIKRFHDYAASRLTFVAEMAPYFRALNKLTGQENVGTQAGRGGGVNLFRSVLNPRTLDDSGSMCAAMIKAQRAGVKADMRPLIDNYMTWIMEKQQRLSDGTFSRSRPLPDSVWLDDLYMSIPALAQMGVLTGDTKYWEEAVRQITQFASRMFNHELGLWQHGWIQSMEEHPAFRWGRANGWALLAMCELLDVLPAKFPGRDSIMDLFRAHVRGLVRVQAKDGRWHQLLDRSDSYLETSATSIYTYCIAHAINKGWLDAAAYGPMITLAWHRVADNVNEKGQVVNVCVGTGMGFDPAFYYSRPVSAIAPHGYGPALLAGAEMIAIARSGKAIINDEAVMFGRATGM